MRHWTGRDRLIHMGKIGGVVVTHGQLANELLSAARMVVGDTPDVAAVSIDWNDDVETARGIIEKTVNETDRGRGVIVLTDMFGGTPTNLVMTYGGPVPIEIITGVNLPMIIKLATQGEDEALPDLARKVRDQGKQNIYLASEVMAHRPK